MNFSVAPHSGHGQAGIPGLRRKAIGVLVLMLTLPLWAHAGDCLPLPDSALRALDDSAWSDPVGASAEARRRLSAAVAPLEKAQLRAIILSAVDPADAEGAEPQDQRRQALEELSEVPPTGAVRVLGWRLAMQYDTDNDRWVQSLDRVIRETPDHSYEHACAMAGRLWVSIGEGAYGRAADDAATVIEQSRPNGWDLPLSMASYDLSQVYYDVGMYADALALLDDALRIARARQMRADTFVYLTFRSEILAKLNRLDEAVSTLRSLENSADIQSPNDRQWVETTLCGIYVDHQSWPEAEQVCSPLIGKDLGQMGRLKMELLSAELRVAQHRPREALYWLDDFLRSPNEDRKTHV